MCILWVLMVRSSPKEKLGNCAWELLIIFFSYYIAWEDRVVWGNSCSFGLLCRFKFLSIVLVFKQMVFIVSYEILLLLIHQVFGLFIQAIICLTLMSKFRWIYIHVLECLIINIFLLGVKIPSSHKISCLENKTISKQLTITLIK